MKQPHAAILALAISFATFAIAQDDDFRGSTWGATAQQVRQAEDFELVGETDNNGNTLLIYTGEVGNLAADTFYEVSPSTGLFSAAYIFQEEHANSQDFINDFEQIEAILTRVYGQPSSKNELWDGDLFKDNPEQYGTAVAAGYLKYSTIWETETTQIHHTMTGDNFEINHGVNYLDLDSMQDQQEERQGNEEEGF